MISDDRPATGGRGFKSRRDYPTALRLIRPLAEQGDANAQYNLGVFYDNGLGRKCDNFSRPCRTAYDPRADSRGAEAHTRVKAEPSSKKRRELGCPLLALSGKSDRTRVCPLLEGQPDIDQPLLPCGVEVLASAGALSRLQSRASARKIMIPFFERHDRSFFLNRPRKC
jgi:hypothetical protein